MGFVFKEKAVHCILSVYAKRKLDGHLKNILFASPDRFSGQKTSKFGSENRKYQYYNFWKFQTFVKEENCSKHLPPVQKIIHLCIINFHLFLFIGNGTSWVNYLMRQNRNFMFVLIHYQTKKAALSHDFFCRWRIFGPAKIVKLTKILGEPKLRAICKIYLKGK